MVQWINLLWYNSFVSRWQLSEKLELTAGWQADKIVLNLEIFKII